MDDGHCWHAGNSWIETLEPHPGEPMVFQEHIGASIQRGALVPQRRGPPTITFRGRDYEVVSVAVDGDRRSYQVRGEPRPHAPAEHDKAGAWNAFGLVDMVGNVDEVCADRPNMRGNFATEPRDMGRLSEYEACTVSNDIRVGFRAALNIPGV